MEDCHTGVDGNWPGSIVSVHNTKLRLQAGWGKWQWRTATQVRLAARVPAFAVKAGQTSLIGAAPTHSSVHACHATPPPFLFLVSSTPFR